MYYPHAETSASYYTSAHTQVGSRLISLGQNLTQGLGDVSTVVSTLKSAAASIMHSHPNLAGLLHILASHVMHGGSSPTYSSAHVSSINWGAVATGALLVGAILLG